MSAYKIAIAVTCRDANDEIIFTGADETVVHPPQFCNDDKMMLMIHLEQLAKMYILRILRQHMQENATYFSQQFKDAFKADQWSLHVRVFGIQRGE